MIGCTERHEHPQRVIELIEGAVIRHNQHSLDFCESAPFKISTVAIYAPDQNCSTLCTLTCTSILPPGRSDTDWKSAMTSSWCFDRLLPCRDE